MVESISNVSYMTLLLFLFVFMFAVMGLQVFAGTFDRSSDTYHFDSLGASVLAVMQILTGDDWPLMMQVLMLAGRPQFAGRAHACIMFVVCCMTCSLGVEDAGKAGVGAGLGVVIGIG